MIAFILTPLGGPFSLLLIVIATVVIGGAMLVREQRAESLAVKAVWREALSRHGITHARLASMLGVSVGAVDGALSDARDHPVPEWWMICKGLAPQIRHDVRAGLDALAAADHGPEESLEQGLQRVQIRAANLLTMIGATLSPGAVWRVGSDAAAQIARAGHDLAAAWGVVGPRAHRRVVTGAHAAAKGGPR